MWDRPPRRCIFGAEYRSTCYGCFNATVRPLGSSLFLFRFVAPSCKFTFGARTRTRKITTPRVAVDETVRRVVLRETSAVSSATTYAPGKSNSRVHRANYRRRSFHLRSINYEYRPEDSRSFKWRVSLRAHGQRNVGRNSLSEATPRGDPFSR